jgi:hypothetical protein
MKSVVVTGGSAGILDALVAGPARIEGDGGARTIRVRQEFFMSRQRDLAKLGAAGGLFGAGAGAGIGLSRLLSRLCS